MQMRTTMGFYFNQISRGSRRLGVTTVSVCKKIEAEILENVRRRQKGVSHTAT